MYAVHHRKQKAAECCTRWIKNNPERWLKLAREGMRQANAKCKAEVLAHYGKHKKAMCKWSGCSVSDLDMLTLDHVLDNGATDGQRRGLTQGGASMKRTLIKLGWPKEFQTLCWNHQWKKENLRRRANRI